MSGCIGVNEAIRYIFQILDHLQFPKDWYVAKNLTIGYLGNHYVHPNLVITHSPQTTAIRDADILNEMVPWHAAWWTA